MLHRIDMLSFTERRDHPRSSIRQANNARSKRMGREIENQPTESASDAGLTQRCG